MNIRMYILSDEIVFPIFNGCPHCTPGGVGGGPGEGN